MEATGRGRMGLPENCGVAVGWLLGGRWGGEFENSVRFTCSWGGKALGVLSMLSGLWIRSTLQGNSGASDQTFGVVRGLKSIA